MNSIRVLADVYVEKFRKTQSNGTSFKWNVRKAHIIVADDGNAKEPYLMIPNMNKCDQCEYNLKESNFQIHYKFLHEGKITIRILSPIVVHIMLSKADPHKLKRLVRFFKR